MRSRKVRRLSDSEREKLCDLFAKCGEGDLLDFIRQIKIEAKRLGIPEQEIIESYMGQP
jgi:hypothetical protein